MRRIFLRCVAGLLIAYAFFGKGAAYWGVKPVFVGELVLLLGLCVALVIVPLRVGRLLREPLLLVWTCLAIWCAIRTVPYIPQFGLDALRDAVLWGYGVFAVCLVVALRKKEIHSALVGYAKWARIYLLVIPLLCAVQLLAGNRLPFLPGTDIPVILLKSGDIEVHLAGTAAFLLLGLGAGAKKTSTLFSVVCVLGWLSALVYGASLNRGGFLSVILALFTIFVLRRSASWMKYGVACLTLFVVLAVSGIEYRPPNSERVISPQQLAMNLFSVVDSTGDIALDGTREWRLNWWHDIESYTLKGPYFWTGKGFGVNLADDDGYQVLSDGSLRSPHNGHLDMLARAGVPGFVLWIALNLGFASGLVLSYYKARRYGWDMWARVDLWLLAYWVAFVVNAAFDVFLEGPQGGIWFWCLIGFGISVMRMQASQRQHANRTGTLSAAV